MYDVTIIIIEVLKSLGGGEGECLHPWVVPISVVVIKGHIPGEEAVSSLVPRLPDLFNTRERRGEAWDLMSRA